MTTAAPIQRVAIIGAGACGAGEGQRLDGMTLALLCGRAGFATVLEDVLPGNLRRAGELIDEADRAFLPRYATSIEDAVRDADLVIDTVPDELESKLEILSLLDRMAPPHTLFATPTSTLSIADLASCTYRPGQCVGLRFPGLLPAMSWRVVVTRTPACEPETSARLGAFFHALGAEVEHAEDTSRLP